MVGPSASIAKVISALTTLRITPYALRISAPKASPHLALGHFPIATACSNATINDENIVAAGEYIGLPVGVDTESQRLLKLSLNVIYSVK